MATFADWLNAHAGSEDLRAKVTAVAVCLDDLKACSEEMLSHALNLDDWPLLEERNPAFIPERFVQM